MDLHTNKTKKMIDNVMKFLLKIGIDITFFAVGLIGGLLNIKKHNDLSIKNKIIIVLSGGFTATYLTPLVVEIFQLSDKTAYGVAFFLGYFGLNSMELIIKKLTKKVENEQK